jgi:hypothetical protein
MGDAIDTQGAVDNAGIGIEVAFPIVVAENDQRRSGSAILVRSERPAKDWLDRSTEKKFAETRPPSMRSGSPDVDAVILSSS